MSEKAGSGESERSIITKEFLEKAIRSKERRSDITVESFNFKPRPEEQKLFLSLPYFTEVQVKVSETFETHNLFIKVIRDNDVVKEILLNNLKLYLKEQTAYRDIIPEMIRCQHDSDNKICVPSTPRYYYSLADSYTGVVVLEDLSSLGYHFVDRHQSLNFEECSLVMKDLAIFHALSIAIKKKNPEKLKSFEGLFHESSVTSPLNPYLMNGLKISLQMAKMFSDNVSTHECAEKLQKMDLEKTLKELIKPVEPYATICHGDAACNNMLFKYKENERRDKPHDMKMIDLQMIRYALPTTDLAYFIFTSTNRTLRKLHMKNLLKLYHQIFIHCLESLSIDFPEFTFSVLEKMFEESMLFGIVFGCMILPHNLTAPGDTPNLDLDGVQESDLDAFFDDFFKRVVEVEDNKTIIKERIIGILEDATEMKIC